MIEVADATMKAGLDRGQASEVLSKLAEELKTRQPEPGFTIQECYDLVNHKPTPDFMDAYKKVKDRLSELGLDFSREPSQGGVRSGKR